MKKNQGYALVLTVTAWLCLTFTYGADQDAVQPDHIIRLFNGKDMSSFYTWLVDSHYEDPKRVFSVVDQIDGSPAIRVSGEQWGGFATREKYRDYRLVVEFRWGLVTWGNRKNASRDSGILVHCQGPDGNTGKEFNGPWMRSIESQIIEGGVGDIILVAGRNRKNVVLNPTVWATVREDRDGETVFDPAGELRKFTRGRINWSGRDPDWKDVLGFRGANDVESPVNEWTQVEVTCRRNSIQIRVNGKLVNQASDITPTSGKIMFQSEGAEIFFRRIELHPLTNKT